MANESKPGHKGKVTLGANQVLGLGSYNMSGMSREELDDTEFGDDYKEFEFGLIDSGTIEFAGLYKKDDTTGQDVLASGLINGTDITDIRFYIDSVSYFTPNSTNAAGGGLPADSPVSHVNITAHKIDFDKGSLGSTSFTARVSGVLRLI